jgi:hypothetical protein
LLASDNHSRISLKEALINLFTLQPQNLILEVYVALCAAYLALLIIFVSDVITSKLTGWMKLFSVVGLVCVPFVGMYIYLFCSIIYADRSLLNRIGLGKVSAGKSK